MEENISWQLRANLSEYNLEMFFLHKDSLSVNIAYGKQNNSLERRENHEH
jgi:hypothetical protein